MNPAISKLSFALSSAGSAASAAMKELSGIGGAIGPIAALSAGAATGLAAIAIGAAGIASHAAESASKMYDLSQQTGVSVETLSRFAFAAKQSGVDSGAMQLGLERLSKSAYAAATAPAGAANAYTRLGVAVRDAAGDLRPVQDIALDIADKFSKMPNGVAKTALAFQILGRSGAELIPFFNEGSAGLQKLMEMSDRLGATLSGPTAEAAHNYQQTLGQISAAADGAANTLMVQMLPALQAVASQMASAASSQTSFGKDFLFALADIGKAIIVIGETMGAVFMQVSLEFRTWLTYIYELYSTIASASSRALHFDWSGAKQSVKDGLANIGGDISLFLTDSKKNWQDYGAFIGQVYGKIKPPATAPHPGGNDGTPKQDFGPQASGRADVISELISKLQAQAAAETALAAATEKSVAASVMAKAAAEAETKIGEERAMLMEQESSLRGQLADAQREAASGQSSGGERVPRINAEIAGIQKMLAELQKDAPQIKALYADIAAGDFGTKASKDIQEFITKTKEEGAAAREMAAAYAQGPLAVQQAIDAAKLAPYKKQLEDLIELIGRLKAAGSGQLGAKQMGPSMNQLVLGNLETSRDQLSSGIGQATKDQQQAEKDKVAEAIGKEKAEIDAEAESYRILGAAALLSAAAQRQAAAQAATAKFGGEHTGATQADLQGTPATATQKAQPGIYQAELSKAEAAYQATVAQAAAEEDLNVQYDRELEKLEEVRAFLVSSGQSTMQVDNAMWSARIQFVQQYLQQVMQAQNQELLGNAKLYDSQQQLIEQWDQAALKVGTLAQQMAAFFSMVQQQGANLGEHVFSTLSKSLDDLSTQLADFVVTGKANFRELLRSLEEGLLKSTFQKTFSSVAGGISKSLGLPTPQQQLGTAGNPMFVRIAGMLPMGGQGGPGGPGGSYSGPLADSTGSGFLPFTPPGNSSGSGFVPFTAQENAMLGLNGGSTQAGAAASSSSGLSGFIRSLLNLGMPKQGGGMGQPGGTPPFFGGQPFGPPGAGGGAGGSFGLGAVGSAANPMYVIQAPSAMPGLPGSSGAPGAPGGMGGGFGSMFGLGGGSSSTSLLSAPDGTQSNPFYVTMTSEMGGMGGMFGGGGSGSGGGSFLDMFSGGSGSGAGGGSFLDMFSGGGGGMGGGMSEGGGGLMSLFGGGADAAAGGAGGLSDLMDFLPMLAMESGGDVTPGNAYIIGEKRPEVFVPTTSGRIVPSLGEFARSAEAQAGASLIRSSSSIASDLTSSEKSFMSASLEKTSKSFANSTLKNSAASIVSALPRREYGGSVTAGNPYLAGEARPEVFVPNSTPSNANASSSGNSGPHTVSTNVFHFHGVTDHDSFKKSQGQISADMQREMNRAFYRNSR
jgi:hypothetical protein